MRLVVDTNVFVSAALKQVSWPATTLRWIARYGGLLKSSDTVGARAYGMHTSQTV